MEIISENANADGGCRMHVEMVSTETRDGLQLDGILSEPQGDSLQSIALDGLIFLHGVGGNFYGGRLFPPLMQRMQGLGLPVLRVNTRGHGSVNIVAGRRGALRQGAAYEVVDDSRHDIDAWVNFLVGRGLRRIGLLGHSLGAVKAVFSQAHEPHNHVSALLAISPPRLSYQTFMSGSDRDLFLPSLHAAQQLVAAGEPETLFTANYPLPLLISAASFLDKYGPGERYDILRYLPQLQVPTLFVYGSREVESGRSAFQGLPGLLEQHKPSLLDMEVAVIPNADHFYTGTQGLLADQISHWLAARWGQQPPAASEAARTLTSKLEP